MNCPFALPSKLSLCFGAHPHVSLYASHKCDLILHERIVDAGGYFLGDVIDEQDTYINQLQFSRYITTPSTTTATSSSDLDPPLAPPPPPPPLVIPPSRARRQLAARLALHSKQNAEKALSSNGSEPQAEKADPRKNLNPFATEEDDDDDGREDFTIGDIEIAAEGKGILPPATVLTGQQVPLDDLSLDLEENGRNNHVGISKSSTITRANFPSMWPFGQNNRSSHDYEVSAAYREKERERERARVRMNLSSGNLDIVHDRNASGTNANESFTQSSDDSGSSDDSDDEFATRAGIAGAKGKGGRRPSTTEAKRRTSLEDDDEEEVVHVGRAAAGDDDELIEIQHTEMQGVESDHHAS